MGAVIAGPGEYHQEPLRSGLDKSSSQKRWDQVAGLEATEVTAIPDTRSFDKVVHVPGLAHKLHQIVHLSGKARRKAITGTQARCLGEESPEVSGLVLKAGCQAFLREHPHQ